MSDAPSGKRLIKLAVLSFLIAMAFGLYLNRNSSQVNSLVERCQHLQVSDPLACVPKGP